MTFSVVGTPLADMSGKSAVSPNLQESTQYEIKHSRALKTSKTVACSGRPYAADDPHESDNPLKSLKKAVATASRTGRTGAERVREDP